MGKRQRFKPRAPAVQTGGRGLARVIRKAARNTLGNAQAGQNTNVLQLPSCDIVGFAPFRLRITGPDPLPAGAVVIILPDVGVKVVDQQGRSQIKRTGSHIKIALILPAACSHQEFTAGMQEEAKRFQDLHGWIQEEIDRRGPYTSEGSVDEKRGRWGAGQ